MDHILEALCRAASPRLGESRFDLEAALTKARLNARVSADAGDASVRVGRFEVLRWLGRGGMGSVFEALDLQHGARVALKVLHPPTTDAFSGDALLRLKREFRRVADISHPNLVAMYELHVERNLPFFTMELVDGRSLRELLLTDSPLEEATLCSCMLQLVDALSAVHAHDTVHGDIKPSNVLFGPGGRLTLLDFGVARTLLEPHGARSSGTLRYMAPERLQRGEARSGWDYYAVGALLRELLDHAPTRGARAPARPAYETLQQLCRGLLDPDHRTRFGAEQIANALGGRALSLPAQSDDAVFVGREAELDVLRRAVLQVQSRSVVCMVRGEPGVGKTALVRHALARAELDGALVLTGKCYQAEALTYKGLDGVVDSLASQLQELPPRVWNTLSAHDARSLTRVFPAFERTGLFESGRPADADDPRWVRRRAFHALCSLLAAVAEQRRVVVFIDDLQWGDADGAALLEHLLCGPERPLMLLIASVRDGESSACVAALEAATRVCASVDFTLTPLDGPACQTLARRISGDSLADSVVENLHHESGGNPLFLRALLAATPSDEHASSRSFQTLLRSRLERLDGDSRELLGVATISGGPASLRLLGMAAGVGERAWQPLVTLRNQKLLRTISENGNVQVLPHHDRVREAMLSLVPDERKLRWHESLARAAVMLELDDPAFIAEHFYRANNAAESARYSELAGDRARHSMAFSRARELYERALVCLASARPAELVLKLADAAGSIGDLKAAAPLYIEAAAAHNGDAETALRLRAAEMYLLGGAEHEGRRLLEPALRRTGIPLPSSTLGLVMLGVRSLLFASVARLVFRDRRPLPADSRVELSFRVGYELTVLSPAQGMALLLWSAARALQKGSPVQRGRALAQLAHVLCVLGWIRPAGQDAMLNEALELTQSDPTAHIHTLIATSLVHFIRTEFGMALEHMVAATRLMATEPVDALGFGAHAHAAAATVCVVAGEFLRLDAFAADAEREAVDHGNHAAASQLRSACAWRALSRGDLDPMERYAREDRERWNGKRLTPLYGLAIWGEAHRLLYAGEHAAAADLMALEAPRFMRSGVGRVQPWSVTLKYLWGRITLANSEREGDRALRVAASYARALDRDPSACARGLAELLRGGLAKCRGEPAAALGHYVNAESELARVGILSGAAAAAYRVAELRSMEHPANSVPWFAAQGVSDPARWVHALAP
jgi:hypothetical protein